MLPHVLPAPAIPTAPRPCLFTTVFFGANDAAAPHVSPCQHVPAEEYEDNVAAIAVAAAAVSEAVLVISPPPVDAVRWPDRSNAEVRRYTEACARAVDRARVLVRGASCPSVEDTARAVGGAGAAEGASATVPPILMINLLDLMLSGTSAPLAGHLLSSPPSSIAVAAASVGVADIAAAAGAAATMTEPWRAFLNDGLHLSAAGNALVFRAVMAAIAENAPSCLPEALPWDFPYWKDIDNSSVDTVAAAFSPASLAATRAAAAGLLTAKSGPSVDVRPGGDGNEGGPARVSIACRERGCKTASVCTCIE